MVVALPGAARAETQADTRVVVTTLHIDGTAQQRVFEAALSAAVDRANRELGTPSFTLTAAPQAGTAGRIDVTAVNLVRGGSVFAVELDPLFRVVGSPGRSLLEQGNFNYAMQTSSTAAGTLFLRAGSGGGL
jgi:hypothetical protein